MKAEILKKEIIYKGFFRLSRLTIEHNLYQGGKAKVVRELLERGHAVAVLLYDAHQDRVVLVEQFRVGVLEDENSWLLEVVAGMIEEGEEPEEVAFRESMEEAGCKIKELIKIGQYYSSPGGSSEKITLYCGQVNSQSLAEYGGVSGEGEDIRVVCLSAEEAFFRLENGAINSATPMIALHWLLLNQERLQARWGI